MPWKRFDSPRVSVEVIFSRQNKKLRRAQKGRIEVAASHNGSFNSVNKLNATFCRQVPS
jgi:hypothetical protein